jgi:hypothetical protein
MQVDFLGWMVERHQLQANELEEMVIMVFLVKIHWAHLPIR